MTLRDQIKAIHAKHFGKEFHDFRKDLIPAMVNDLKMKFFDDMVLVSVTSRNGSIREWCYPDTVEMRAVRQANTLISSVGLRVSDPAVE